MKPNCKTLGTISFIVSLLSPFMAMALVDRFGEVEIFSTAGMQRYSWIFWIFIPVVAISYLLGKKLKEAGLKYKHNYIIAFVLIPIFIIFGSFRWMFPNTYFDDQSNIKDVETQIGIDLPDDLKTSTSYWDDHILSYAKILNSQEKENFENEIANSSKWTNNWGTLIENQMPFDISVYIASFEYCVCVFELEEKTFVNQYPNESGTYDCVFVWYDADLGRIVIYNNCEVTIECGDIENPITQ